MAEQPAHVLGSEHPAVQPGRDIAVRRNRWPHFPAARHLHIASASDMDRKVANTRPMMPSTNHA